MFKVPFKSSIFLKLTFIVIIFGILLNVSLIFVLKSFSDVEPRKEFPKMLREMERYTMKEVGDPPDTVIARRVSEESEVEIRYESPGLNWSSTSEVPTLNELLKNDEFRMRYQEDNRFPFPYKGMFVSVHRTHKGVFIFMPFGSKLQFFPEKAIIALIVLASIILVSLYFVMRKLFSPVKTLTAAVRQIGEGNYNIDILYKSKDELGELASSINDMSNKIKSQIKSKEQLLLDVSHELRTPLTRIKLGLEVDSPKEKINEDVQEMEKMINDLLESFKTESNLEKLNLKETEILTLVRETIEEYTDNDRLKFGPIRESIIVRADADKLQIAFRNLINNALKYSTNGVNIEVTDRLDMIEITIRDTGIGIAKEDLENIFEPFYRADRSRSRDTGGFGLGLSICKKIVEAHKGRISISSVLTQGTAVTIQLPK